MSGKIPTTYIYDVYLGYQSGNRLCRTPREAARCMKANMSKREQACVSLDALESSIKGLTSSKDIRMFNRVVERKTLFG